MSRRASIFLHDMMDYKRSLGSEIGRVPTIHEVCRMYTKVYTIKNLVSSRHSAICEEVYRILNTEHPKDYISRSMSVGDVILIEDNGTNHYYMVDKLGFIKLEA